MQDDVIKVARAMRVARLIWLGLPLEHAEKALALSPLTQAELSEARAAMSATREIDAGALLKIAARHKRHGRPQASSEAKDNANWLQQRANDVKGCGNG